MRIDELTLNERQVLFGLLAHVALADATMDPEEMARLEAIGREMGIRSLEDTLGVAMRAFATPDDTLGASARVARSNARALIRSLLHELAYADGDRSAEEDVLLHRLDALWAP